MTVEQQEEFKATLRVFVQGLQQQKFHPSLRVKRVAGTRAIWEMTWAPDGRATFTYGTEMRPGDPHIIWRRVGTHAIFRVP